MKIAWHMPTLRRACCGLSTRALRLADGLRQHGHEVAFWVDARKTDVSADSFNGFRVQPLTAKRSWTPHWSLQALSRRRAAAALVPQFCADHDVALTCQPEFATVYISRTRRAPLVFVCGGSTLLHDGADRARSAAVSWPHRQLYALDRLLKHASERAAFAHADAVVFDSDATRLRVAHDYGLCPSRFHTIHGGVDPGEFQPPSRHERENARRKLNIGDDEFVIIWTGRLSPEKNIDLLLRAQACGRRRPHRVLIVGDGPAREELEILSHHLGLSSSVSFLGAQTDVRPFLRAGDTYVFPSRGESFGGALVEAMACGLPCIALRPNGEDIRNASLEIIDHEKSGLLVDQDDPAALASAIECLLVDCNLRTAIGQAARRRAEASFTWPAAATQLEQLLTTIVAGRRGSQRLLNTSRLTPVLPGHA